MNIFIDESGSFVSAQDLGAWNAVAAFVLPEKSRRGLEMAVADLKRGHGRVGKREVKLRELGESEYISFLVKLAKLDGCLFFIATDAGLNTPESVRAHQRCQAEKIRLPIEKMRFESGRQAVERLAEQIENLPPQLYVQLFCQIELMYEVVSRAVTYYVQRNPGTLSEFRWRIDQKNHIRTLFEDAFEKLSPVILQTMSLTKPLLMVKEFDYSRMQKYEYAPGEMPTYLTDHYGIPMRGEGGFNIQKIIRGNLQFMDSRESDGLQAVDLIVSGIRRCLRGNFQSYEEVATHLGCLITQAIHDDFPFRLVSFGDEAPANPKTKTVANLMRKFAKPMLL